VDPQGLKEFTKYVVDDLSPIQQFKIEERAYSAETLIEIKTPVADPVKVGTLSALCNLTTNKLDELNPAKVAFHIVSPTRCDVISLDVDAWAQRRRYGCAEVPQKTGFTFDTYWKPEAFVIALLANFLVSPDLKDLISLASNLQSELIGTSVDDGVSQSAAIRTGAVSKSTVAVKPRWLLQPFRTFREVEQPMSEFIFRLKNDEPGNPPKCALIEADGGGWQLDAVKNISAWLNEKLSPLDATWATRIIY